MGYETTKREVFEGQTFAAFTSHEYAAIGRSAGPVPQEGIDAVVLTYIVTEPVTLFLDWYRYLGVPPAVIVDRSRRFG